MADRGKQWSQWTAGIGQHALVDVAHMDVDGQHDITAQFICRFSPKQDESNVADISSCVSVGLSDRGVGGAEDENWTILGLTRLQPHQVRIADRIVLSLEFADSYRVTEDKMLQQFFAALHTDEGRRLLAIELNGLVVKASEYCIINVSEGVCLRFVSAASSVASRVQNSKQKTAAKYPESPEQETVFYYISMSRTSIVIVDGHAPAEKYQEQLAPEDNKSKHTPSVDPFVYETHAVKKLHEFLVRLLDLISSTHGSYSIMFENVLVAAPSGCGRTTLVNHVCKYLCAERPDSISLYRSVKDLRVALESDRPNAPVALLVLDDADKSRTRYQQVLAWLYDQYQQIKQSSISFVITIIVATSSKSLDSRISKYVSHEFSEQSAWKHFSESFDEKMDLFKHLLSQFAEVTSNAIVNNVLVDYVSELYVRIYQYWRESKDSGGASMPTDRSLLYFQAAMQKITIIRDLVSLSKEVYWRALAASSRDTASPVPSLVQLVSDALGALRLDAPLSASAAGEDSIIYHYKIDHYRDASRYTWDRIGGLEEVKSKIRQCVEWPLNFAEQFRKLNIAPSNSNTNNILLYGPPGCAKTTLVRTLVHYIPLIKHFYTLNAALLYSKYLGEAERYLRLLFKQARQHYPCVIFIDEIDTIVANRNEDGAGGGGSVMDKRVLSTLLNEMDGIEQNVGSNGLEGDSYLYSSHQLLLIICATNRPDMIDSALMRPGRLDHLIYVTLPDFLARQSILTVYLTYALEYSPVSKHLIPLVSIPIFSFASRTEGYTGADIEALVREALVQALVRSRQPNDESLLTMEYLHAAFDHAFRAIKPSVSDLSVYERFQKKFYKSAG